MASEYMTPQDVAEKYNITVRTAYKWIHRAIAAGYDGIKERRILRITEAAMEEYLCRERKRRASIKKKTRMARLDAGSPTSVFRDDAPASNLMPKADAKPK